MTIGSGVKSIGQYAFDGCSKLIDVYYIGTKTQWNANTIATAIGEDQGTYEEVYEPFLIKEGFIVRTQRGRIATELSYKHLGIEKEVGEDTLFG